MSDRPLTTKQRLFAEAYLANPNATEAARKAGYKGTDKALSVMGVKLLGNARISEFVTKRVTNAAMSADEVLSELASVARAPWKDFFEYVTDNEGSTVKINVRLTDKLKALELVGKHHKLFTEKSEVTGKDGGPQEHEIRVILPKE